MGRTSFSVFRFIAQRRVVFGVGLALAVAIVTLAIAMHPTKPPRVFSVRTATGEKEVVVPDGAKPPSDAQPKSAQTKGAATSQSSSEEQVKHATDTIAQGVSTKRLTTQQANLATAKLEEIRQFQDGLAKLSVDERSAALHQKDLEYRSWASEHDIPYYFIDILD